MGTKFTVYFQDGEIIETTCSWAGLKQILSWYSLEGGLYVVVVNGFPVKLGGIWDSVLGTEQSKYLGDFIKYTSQLI